MATRWWTWARLVGGAAVIGVLTWRVGTGPFLDGVRSVDLTSLVLAAAIAVPTTVCCAWRWTLVARGLGLALPLRAAVPAYFGSQLLNTTLPGGVLGDVHRAVRHGHDVGDTGRGLRAVGWERVAGQAVQLVLAAAVLLLLPSAFRASVPTVVVGAVAVTVVALAVLLGARGRAPVARVLRVAHADVSTGLLARAVWPGVAIASTVAVAGHLGTFLVAARAAGVDASPVRLLPVALLVLLAMAVPANVAGWGPREGVAAWAFGVAGLGAAEGVTTAVVYGVLALAVSLPGVVVLAATFVHRAGARQPALTPREPVAVTAGGACHD